MNIELYQLIILWVFAAIGAAAAMLALYATVLYLWDKFDHARHDSLKKQVDQVCATLQVILLNKHAGQEALWALEIIMATLHDRWHPGKHELRHSVPLHYPVPALEQGYRVWYDGCNPAVPVWSATGKAGHYTKVAPWTKGDTRALRMAFEEM
jgi:hypothetical protein